MLIPDLGVNMDRQVSWAYGIAGLALAVATAAFVGAGTDTSTPVIDDTRVERSAQSEEQPPEAFASSAAPAAEEVVYVDERGNPLPTGWRARGGDDDDDDHDDDDHDDGDDDDDGRGHDDD